MPRRVSPRFLQHGARRWGTRLRRLARPWRPGRRERALRAGRPPQHRAVGSGAGDARVPGRHDRLVVEGTDLGGDPVNSFGCEGLVEPRSSGVGRLQAGQDQPAGCHLRAARDGGVLRRRRGRIEQLTAADIDRADVVAKVHAAELSVTHYMATPEHFLWHVRQAEDSGSAAEFLSAAIVDEKSVWDYNRGLSSRDGITEELLAPPKEPLVPIYPSDGTFVADSPIAVLNASWSSSAERAASVGFSAFARTAQGQAVVRAKGYRDVNGHADRAVSSTGHYGPPVESLQLPSAEVLEGIVHDFPSVRKRARVLFLLDVSGSMGDQIAPGLTRLAAAKHALVAALAHFTSADQVGLAAFSNRAGGAIVPGIVSPVTALGTGRGGCSLPCPACRRCRRRRCSPPFSRYRRWRKVGVRT